MSTWQFNIEFSVKEISRDVGAFALVLVLSSLFVYFTPCTHTHTLPHTLPHTHSHRHTHTHTPTPTYTHRDTDTNIYIYIYISLVIAMQILKRAVYLARFTLDIPPKEN